jgi:hypothetical protein
MAERQQVDAAKVVKLLEIAKDLYVKQGAILEEIDALVHGKAGIGAKLKALEEAYDGAWCERYARGQRGVYVWNYREDRPQSKRLLARMSVEEIGRRALAYIRCEDPFYANKRHPFSLFIRSINEWTNGKAAPEEVEPVGGCKHDPPCRSDQEHTRRRAADMRAAQ